VGLFDGILERETKGDFNISKTKQGEGRSRSKNHDGGLGGMGGKNKPSLHWGTKKERAKCISKDLPGVDKRKKTYENCYDHAKKNSALERGGEKKKNGAPTLPPWGGNGFS